MNCSTLLSRLQSSYTMRITRSMTRKEQKRRASTSALEVKHPNKKQWQLKRHELYDLKSMLECPVCFELPRLKSPIYGCRNGHVLCQHCSAKVQHCPICRNVDMKCRSLIVEQLLTTHFKGEVFKCRHADCIKYLDLSTLNDHEPFCHHREVCCPSGRRGTCQWNGPLSKLMSHIKAQKCVQILLEIDGGEDAPNRDQIKEALFKDRGLYHEPKFDSSIGDFPEESKKSVFDKGNLVTHWKPVLMLSRNIMDFWVYMTIERNSMGKWFLMPFAMVADEIAAQIHLKIIVGEAIYEGPVNSFQASKDDVARSGNLLLLDDDQVRKLKKERTLFEYKLQVKADKELLFNSKRSNGGCMECKQCLGLDFQLPQNDQLKRIKIE